MLQNVWVRVSEHFDCHLLVSNWIGIC